MIKLHGKKSSGFKSGGHDENVDRATVFLRKRNEVGNYTVAHGDVFHLIVTCHIFHHPKLEHQLLHSEANLPKYHLNEFDWETDVN